LLSYSRRCTSGECLGDQGLVSNDAGADDRFSRIGITRLANLELILGAALPLDRVPPWRWRRARSWRRGGNTVGGFAPCFCLAACTGRQPQRLLDATVSGSHGESAASATMEQPAESGRRCWFSIDPARIQADAG